MKTSIKIVAGILVLLNLCVLSVTNSFGKPAKQSSPASAFIDCKWSSQLCDDGTTFREICVDGGNGAACTCGLVTRFCP